MNIRITKYWPFKAGDCLTEMEVNIGLIHNVSVPGTGTRIAVMTFSSETKILFNLDDPDIRSKEKAIAKINTIQVNFCENSLLKRCKL